MKAPEGFDDYLNTTSKLSVLFAGVEPKRQEIIQDLISAKGVSFPAKLFHYTNSKSLSCIIESNHLWATEFQSLNDATELVHGAILLVDEFEKYGNDSGGDISALLYKLANFYREHGDKLRIRVNIYPKLQYRMNIGIETFENMANKFNISTVHYDTSGMIHDCKCIAETINR